MGVFEMGSTVAVIFECPRNYQILKREGDRIKLGESLIEAIPSHDDELEVKFGE